MSNACTVTSFNRAAICSSRAVGRRTSHIVFAEDSVKVATFNDGYQDPGVHILVQQQSACVCVIIRAFKAATLVSFLDPSEAIFPDVADHTIERKYM